MRRLLLLLVFTSGCFSARVSGGPTLSASGPGVQAKVGTGMGCCRGDHPWFLTTEFGVGHETDAPGGPTLSFGGALDYNSLRGAGGDDEHGLPFRLGLRWGLRFIPDGEDEGDYGLIGGAFALFPWSTGDSGGGGRDEHSKSGPLFDMGMSGYRLMGFEIMLAHLYSPDGPDNWLITGSFVVEWMLLTDFP